MDLLNANSNFLDELKMKGMATATRFTAHACWVFPFKLGVRSPKDKIAGWHYAAVHFPI